MKRKWTLVFTALVLLTLVFSASRVAEAGPVTAPALDSDAFPLGNPAYDSSWVSIATSETITLTHGLGGDVSTYFVDLQGRITSNVTILSQGVDTWDTTTTDGVYWRKLTASQREVYRAGKDTFNPQIRVRIWRARPAAHDSGWVTTVSGTDYTFTHNLGGNTDHYLVYLEFRSAGDGINQMYYGWDTYRETPFQVISRGAYWKDLGPTWLRVSTAYNSTNTESVRVRIWRESTPDYDSGWTTIAAGAMTWFNHELGGPWNDFFVDMQFKHTGWGIHQEYYGRDCYLDSDMTTFRCRGAHWAGMTGSKLSVTRAQHDEDIDEVRVRIWANRKPKYDSGSTAISPSSLSATYTHNLGGNPDSYVVDLQFEDTAADGYSGAGVNHWNFGSDWYCGSPTTLKKEGAYWWGLTSSGLQLGREAQDVLAAQIRVRIWKAGPVEIALPFVRR